MRSLGGVESVDIVAWCDIAAVGRFRVGMRLTGSKCSIYNESVVV